MGGIPGAFYDILVCSRREAMVFKPKLTELALPMVKCRYMDESCIFGICLAGYRTAGTSDRGSEVHRCRGYWLPSPSST